MFDTRKKLLALGGITIVLLVVLFFAIRSLRDGEEVVPTTPPTPSSVIDPAPVVSGSNGQVVNIETPSPVPAMSPSDRYLIQLSKIFIERFGSHSSQNDNTHITDVQPLVTASMARWLGTQGQEQDREYSGITTKVITASLQSNSQGKAVVLFEAQRILRGAVEKREYQKGRVELVEESPSIWKVNGLYIDKK